MMAFSTQPNAEYSAVIFSRCFWMPLSKVSCAPTAAAGIERHDHGWEGRPKRHRVATPMPKATKWQVAAASRTHDLAVAPASNKRGGAAASAQDHTKRNAEMRAELPLVRCPVWAALIRVRRWRIEAGPRTHSGKKSFRNWQF